MKKDTQKRQKVLLTALLAVLAVICGYAGIHWFSTAAGDDLSALERQATDYLGCKLSIEEVAQRGDYLAALCKEDTWKWRLCVFDRDRLFPGRWRANGGAGSSQELDSWNFGSPQGEAVLIFYGGGLSEEICGYTFQNSGITYTCPVADNTVLDLFIIPDGRHDINGVPTPLDCNGLPIH